jgi:MSHA biogenesis protein MshM
MYLEHFNIASLPFTLTPNTQLYCSLPTHKEALDVLLFSLKHDEGFIKITGEVGTGKTLLCRLLLKNLPHNFVSLYMPNPKLSTHSLHLYIANELDLSVPPNKQYDIIELIFRRLIELTKEGKKIVLIIDEAQTMPDATIEAIRLLTNLETEKQKLLQVVFFGQPELDNKLNSHNLRQLKQRITFSYKLSPLNRRQVQIYINHRLATSGYTYGNLFSKYSYPLIYRATHGLPRLINIICHKALLSAYGQGRYTVRLKDIKNAIFDTESAYYRPVKLLNVILLFSLTIAVSIGCMIIAIEYKNGRLPFL